MALSIVLPIVGVLLTMITIWILKLRRVVPTNFVHIVQYKKSTISYGIGETSNVYYEFPIWVPQLGVTVRELPVSNFDIDLASYPAYDINRVPFHVDVKAFFCIENTATASAKVKDFDDLEKQLKDVVRGAVRSILAKSELINIMEERAKFAADFTKAVAEDLKAWGVKNVKSIELMDVRDEPGQQVIEQIMDKQKSAIEKDSRIEVAQNIRDAQKAELEATKEVQVKDAQTKKESGEAKAKSNQAVAIANAEATKRGGVAQQEAIQDIATAESITKEEQMKVIKVEQVRQEEINKEREIIEAEKERRQVEINADAQAYNVDKIAEADLSAKKKNAAATREVGTAEADVILAKGTSEAEAEKLEQLASVIAQITLAKDIGNNEGYQKYLIDLRSVEKDEAVGLEEKRALGMALKEADLNVLVNSGDVNSGINSFADLLSSKGGSQVNGIIEALKQTEEGRKLIGLIPGLGGDAKGPKKNK